MTGQARQRRSEGELRFLVSAFEALDAVPWLVEAAKAIPPAGSARALAIGRILAEWERRGHGVAPDPETISAWSRPRARRAIEMRAAGATYKDIAAELGINAQRAAQFCSSWSGPMEPRDRAFYLKKIRGLAAEGLSRGKIRKKLSAPTVRAIFGSLKAALDEAGVERWPTRAEALRRARVMLNAGASRSDVMAGKPIRYSAMKRLFGSYKAYLDAAQDGWEPSPFGLGFMQGRGAA